MRVALTFPSFTHQHPFYGGNIQLEPCGLIYLSSRLVAEGHETLVIDQSLQKFSDTDLLSRLNNFKPDLVGFSIIPENFHRSLRLAKTWKKQTNTPVLAGNIYPTLHPEITKLPEIDVAVIGEGEDTLLDLVEQWGAAGNLHGVSGSAWSEDDEMHVELSRSRIRDLDRLPFPDRRFFDPEMFIEPLFTPMRKRCSFSVVTSRGCGMHCGFCSSPMMWGGSWVGRSPENIVAEILSLRDSYHMAHVSFMDEEINFDRKRALELYHLMKQENLGLSWNAGSSVVKTDSEVARAMVESGMTSLFLGFESGAPEILGKLGKKYDPKDGLKLVKYLQKKRIFVTGSFILGLPWESNETVNQTIQFLQDLNLDFCAINFYRPQPGSEFHKLAIQEGLMDSPDYNESERDPFSPSLSTYHMSTKEIQRSASRMYVKMFLRPTYWFRLLFRSINEPTWISSYAQIVFTFMANGLISVIRKIRGKIIVKQPKQSITKSLQIQDENNKCE